MTAPATIKVRIGQEMVETIRKMKDGHVLSYEEKLDYAVPHKHIVVFSFIDEVIGQPIKVSIETQIGEKQ